MNCSFILPTYNRCPYNPSSAMGSLNPLSWATTTLLSQEGGLLQEIIIVDDGSTDYTPAVVGQVASQAASQSITVKYIRHNTHMGLSHARNTAISNATKPIVVFGDDDCIYPRHYIWGVTQCLGWAHAQEADCFGITMPFYYRSLQPQHTCRRSEIGRIQEEQGSFHTNFHCMPIEDLDQPEYLPGDEKIVLPFNTELINGTCALYTQRLEGVGGFPDVSRWKNAYSEHLELSVVIADAGGRLFHCPDPRFGVCHLKYGAIGRYQCNPDSFSHVIPILATTLGDLITEAEKAKLNNGCRIEDNLFHFSMIGSFFSFFLKRSLPGACKYASRVYKDFVVDGIAYSLAVTEIPNYNTRRKIWREGISAGMDLVRTSVQPAEFNDMKKAISNLCSMLNEPSVLS